MIGQTLGHYEILEKLGAGGMGEVYLAEDTSLKRQVALKVLPPDLAASQERLERFQREAESLAALNHPNIVHVYSVEEDDGTHFLTMELVEGKPLSAVVSERGLPLERFLSMAIELAEAVSAAHEKDVVHRDLKPANIMVTTEDRIKVLDFGLAKLRHEKNREVVDSKETTEVLSDQGRRIGTLPYMSPEQVRGLPADHRSDIFALGVILYEMATGQYPFQKGSSADLASAILRDRPSSVEEIRKDLPHRLGQIVSKCLEKDPGNRLQSVKDLHNEMEGLRLEISSGESDTPPGTFWDRLRKSKAPLLIAAVLVVLVVISRVTEPPARSVESIAVLPLANLSEDPGQDYFAEGMHEELITKISKISSLSVISRASAIRFQDTNQPLSDIARELGIDAILTGSVLKVGDQVRITAELVDGRTEELLWGDSYTRSTENVLALHTDVAMAVAEGVKVNLNPQEQKDLSHAPLIDPAAYEAYLRGRYYWNIRTKESLRLAIDFFKEALDLKPDYARAYAGIADSYYMLGSDGLVSAKVAFPLARSAAIEALRLDQSLAEAHTSLAAVKESFDWDWPSAAESYENAIAFDPSYSTAHHWFGVFLLLVGDPERGLEELNRARSLDPLSSPILTSLAQALIYVGDSSQALDECDRVLDLSPDFARAHSVRGQALMETSHEEAAITAFDRAVSLSGGAGEYLAELAHAYAVMGMRAESEEVLAQALSVTDQPVPWYEIAYVYVGLNEPDRAFDALERAYQQRSTSLTFLRIDPRLQPLRIDPRFERLLKYLRLDDL